MIVFIQEKSVEQPTRGRQTRNAKSNALKVAKPIKDSIPEETNLDSEIEMTESPRPVRQTRKLSKTIIYETPSKRIKMIEETPEHVETETTRTRSQDTKSPKKANIPSKPNKSPKPVDSESDFETEKKVTRQAKAKAVKKPSVAKAKATKATKPNATLDKWIERSDSPLRKSSRLSAQTTPKNAKSKSSVTDSPQISLFDSPVVASPKIAVFKSPGASRLLTPRNGKSPGSKKQSEQKRVPIWRTEPKPEKLMPVPDDIYDFHYDSSERKPLKKKRTRKPKSNDVFKAKNKKTSPKRAPRAARKAVKIQVLSPPSSNNSTTVLLKSVAEKLVPLSETPNSSLISKSNSDLSPIASLDGIRDVSEVVNMEPEAYESCSFEGNKSEESGVLAGDLEHASPEKSTNVSRVEHSIDDCFGFEEQENSPPKGSPVKVNHPMVKSTPLKQMQRPVVASLPSVSPVRKFAKTARKSCSRPARLDQDVAREMIRGIRPLPPVKEKQSTLKQFIKEVGEPEGPSSSKKAAVPPTPPPAFLQVNLFSNTFCNEFNNFLCLASSTIVLEARAAHSQAKHPSTRRSRYRRRRGRSCAQTEKESRRKKRQQEDQTRRGSRRVVQDDGFPF